MNKKTKIWLIVAASLVVVGGLIFGGAMMLLKWDFSLLSTLKYETKEYEISEAYQEISIAINTADVVFVPSEDSKTTVICHEQEKVEHWVVVEDGRLCITANDTRKWYDYIGIQFGTPKITISIPAGEYGKLWVGASTGDVEIPENFKFESIDIRGSTGDITNRASASGIVKIKMTTGDICVENMSADMLLLDVTTGDMELSGIRCSIIETNGDTGDLTMTDVVTTGAIVAFRNTGNIKFDKCDSEKLLFSTQTGDITGSLLSDKIFLVESGTGSVKVPKTTEGGECQVRSETGDIKLKIEKE